MGSVFVEVSLILVLATVVAGLMQLLRQPLIIGHIITGLLVGPHLLNVVHSKETLEIFSHIGVALLLFIIGLSLNPRTVKEVGKAALATGLGQILITTGAGFLIGRTLGYSSVTALYIAVAISFSSTIIIMKLLADKKELGRLYGKISVGFLLVQDIVATIVLISVSSISQNVGLWTSLGTTGLKLAGVVITFFIATRYVLPRMSAFFAKSQELLFIFSIGWGLGVAALFNNIGLSIEIGALFAGVALASSPFSYEISARMRPLRDFFIIVFFILLGSQMSLANLNTMIAPALALSALVLFGNPVIVMVLMKYLGYTKQTNFKAGLAVAQISEFSLILVVLGNRVGHIPQEIISLITIVALITIAGSTYLIIYADKIYGLLEPYLSVFEKKNAKRERRKKEAYDVILFGYRTAGRKFVTSFQELGHKFVVIDYNPDIIHKLTKKKINCRYGAADELELLDELDLQAVKMVVSTIRDYSINALLVRHIGQINPDAVIVVTADEIAEASELYSAGAAYVMMPHYLGSEKTSGLIEKHGFDLSAFIKERDRHLKYIQEVKSASE